MDFSKGLHDELSGQPFVVIEAVDGRVCYAQIDVPTAERIRENDVIRLASRQQDPRGEVGQAKARPVRILGQRLGPPIALQQRYRGPTWLDTIDTTKLPKPARGFAADLAGSLTQRSANVPAMGIHSADPVARAAGLASLEARVVGERLAAERGFTLVEPSRGITGPLTLSASSLRDTDDAPTRLKAYAQLYGKVLRMKRMCLCGVLAADFETLPRPMRAGVLSFFALNEQWLTNVLEEGRRTKTLHFEGRAAPIAAFLVSSLEGAMLLARSYGKVSRFESVATKLLGDLAKAG